MRSLIGILALQGDFERHEARLAELGAKTLLVNSAEQLKRIAGLAIPGGESSVLLRLSRGALQTALKERIAAGLPVLATCAGTILLASGVENPRQESLGLLDIDVRRNAYGRQVDSFIDPSLSWTASGRAALDELDVGKRDGKMTVEGVFIRAPKITRVGSEAETLIERQGDPVFVRQGNIFAATFHPELSTKAKSLHELFLSRCGK